MTWSVHIVLLHGGRDTHGGLTEWAPGFFPNTHAGVTSPGGAETEDDWRQVGHTRHAVSSACLSRGPLTQCWAWGRTGLPLVTLRDSGSGGSWGGDGLGVSQTLRPHSLVLVDAAFAFGVQHLEGI